jgi:biopolymer transport protein ExbB
MSKKEENKLKDMFASLVILVAFVVAVVIFKFVMGAPTNFQDGNPQNEPVTEGFRSYLGTIYKGGFVVPVLMTLLLLVFTFSVERYLTIHKAAGKISAHTFLNKIRSLLASNNLTAVEQECDKQQGSLGNVVKSAMVKYKEVEQETHMDKDQKLVAIQKQIEEATELEMPMLQKNLIILSTISTIGTLFALLGTVLGMIRAFKALSLAGAP